jgi:hypothetical protein
MAPSGFEYSKNGIRRDLLSPGNDQALFNSEFMGGVVNIFNEIAKTARINPLAISCY